MPLVIPCNAIGIMSHSLLWRETTLPLEPRGSKQWEDSWHHGRNQYPTTTLYQPETLSQVLKQPGVMKKHGEIDEADRSHALSGRAKDWKRSLSCGLQVCWTELFGGLVTAKHHEVQIIIYLLQLSILHGLT